MKKEAVETIEVVEHLPSIVDSFNAVFEDIKKHVVGRQSEIDALKLCVLCKQHLLLEGPPGVGKSLLASAFAARVTGVTFFKKLMFKSTQSDEIFGPMSAKKYKEEEIWHHNIEGMLPSAHIAFIDEVYRGSDSILPTMLNVLNEREFINGANLVRCPLITAIGACNTVPTAEELIAFHDRWLIHYTVTGLTAKNQIKAIQMYLEDSLGNLDPEAFISLENIEILNKAVMSVAVPDDVLELYVELVHKYKAGIGNAYISDRRVCHALRIAQAKAVLDGKSDTPLTPEYLSEVQPAFMLPNKGSEAAFSSAFTAVIGGIEKARVELGKFTDIEKCYTELMNRYKRNLPPKKLKTLYRIAKDSITALNDLPSTDIPQTEVGREKLNVLLRGFNDLATGCSESLANVGEEVDETPVNTAKAASDDNDEEVPVN